MKIGFVGLGNMGRGIARNLLKAGHEVYAYNRTTRRAQELARDGARVAGLAEAAATGTVFTMLADDHAVEQCVFGGGGILAGLPRGGLHVSLSTISVALSHRLAEEHGRHGQNYVSAPVFGRPQAAESAQLVVVAAGPAEAVEKGRPMLEAMGRKVFVLGTEAPQANVLKLAGNFLIASMLEALSEAFALARKCGIEPLKYLEIMNTLYQSPIYETYGRIIAEEHFEPAGFKMLLGLKDVRLVLAAGEAAAVPMPLASLVRDHMISGIARGMGEIDWGAIGRVVAEDAGLGSKRVDS
ncbi:MAG TPA: NAD(P)-dependent oxidoreductase [Terriglobia bacterium]|nr:NAD(P)-dependent oxidoreductase [Terriglobia bacterium]